MDFDDAGEAIRLVDQLGEKVSIYKVGLQLLTAAGPAIVSVLVARGKRVFLDLKLLKIPNSVAGAVRVAGQLGASYVTVHASGGSSVLRAAVEAAEPFPDLRVLALTVITSMDEVGLREVGVSSSVDEQVLRLTRLAVATNCHGVVASPLEARILRSELPGGFLVMTPGARMPEGHDDDQARVSTPRAALHAGATHLVIGRPISRAPDPLAAYERIAASIEATDAP